MNQEQIKIRRKEIEDRLRDIGIESQMSGGYDTGADTGMKSVPMDYVKMGKLREEAKALFEELKRLDAETVNDFGTLYFTKKVTYAIDGNSPEEDFKPGNRSCYVKGRAFDVTLGPDGEPLEARGELVDDIARTRVSGFYRIKVIEEKVEEKPKPVERTVSPYLVSPTAGQSIVPDKCPDGYWSCDECLKVFGVKVYTRIEKIKCKNQHVRDSKEAHDMMGDTEAWLKSKEEEKKEKKRQ